MTMVRILFTIIVFFVYNTVVLKIFNIPKHLSITYRLLGNYKEWLRFLFPFFILLQLFLFVPVWWNMTRKLSSGYWRSSWLIPVAAFMMLIIAFSGNYRCNKFLLYVHYTAAFMAGISAVIWIFWVSPFWFVPLCMFVVLLAIAYQTGTLYSSFLYWLELTCFSSLYIAVLLMEIYL